MSRSRKDPILSSAPADKAGGALAPEKSKLERLKAWFKKKRENAKKAAHELWLKLTQEIFTWAYMRSIPGAIRDMVVDAVKSKFKWNSSRAMSDLARNIVSLAMLTVGIMFPVAKALSAIVTSIMGVATNFYSGLTRGFKSWMFPEKRTKYKKATRAIKVGETIGYIAVAGLTLAVALGVLTAAVPLAPILFAASFAVTIAAMIMKKVARSKLKKVKPTTNIDVEIVVKKHDRALTKREADKKAEMEHRLKVIDQSILDAKSSVEAFDKKLAERAAKNPELQAASAALDEGKPAKGGRSARSDTDLLVASKQVQKGKAEQHQGSSSEPALLAASATKASPSRSGLFATAPARRRRRRRAPTLSEIFKTPLVGIDDDAPRSSVRHNQ